MCKLPTDMYPLLYRAPGANASENSPKNFRPPGAARRYTSITTFIARSPASSMNR